MKGIWITWEKQRRNLGISSALSWPLCEIIVNKPRLMRYLYSIYLTLKNIQSDKPDVIAVQNPSIVLAMLGVILKYLFKYTLIIDAHNSGILPAEGKSNTLMFISRWLQRNADITIVTNPELQMVVESNGGKAYVLPDSLPDVPSIASLELEGRVNIVFICTYNVDEPYREVIEAARLLPDDVLIYITGKYQGKVEPLLMPKNVKILGYVSEETFWAMLTSADIIMDLTLREGCLVCGAYEGVALLKPLILSDTRVLRSYFNDGCVYVKPDVSSIASGILEAIDCIDNLHFGISKLKGEIEVEWKAKIRDLQILIKDITI
jgi:glycosyltransferase involved in cell wall biosynthesis